MNTLKPHWQMCLHCQGRGKKAKRIRKKVRLAYQRALQQFENNVLQGIPQGDAPVRPTGHLDNCSECQGAGLIRSNAPREAPACTAHFPNVAIIGGGIGGVALAVACLHRNIPFTLYERDVDFQARSQGYGLTLQQASRVMHGLGILSLEQGVVSTRHVVHSTDGKVLGEWGIRNLGLSEQELKAFSATKRTNIHIARQSLRLALIEQLGGYDAVTWNHQLKDIQENINGTLDLSFQVHQHQIQASADLVVGADGIRSVVRQQLLTEEVTPLRYLGCIVILGICPLADLEPLENEDLLDSATVFQTANGHERIYMMPYDSDSIMWQLSFPMAEAEAKALSEKGAAALKAEAILRCPWHAPIFDILAATAVECVSGYPVYDRTLLTQKALESRENITLIGDAAHPMSPFKGQGANQALLDALSLARSITKHCKADTPWQKPEVKAAVLAEFEAEMVMRSANKVTDSANAAEFLHTDIALHKSDEPRGNVFKTDSAQR